VISAQNAGVDPPYFDVEVQRIKSGAVALPAVTPPIVPTGQFVNVIDPPDPYFANPGERVIYTDASGVGIHQLNLPQPGVPGWVIQVIVLARTTFPNLKAQVLGGAEIYNAQPTNDDRVSPDVQPSGISPLGGKTYEFVGGVVGWLITGFNGQAA
jgi:hypothetical protein